MKIENSNGTVTYRLFYDGIGVQQTFSRRMLELLSATNKQDNWYESKIYSDLLEQYLKLVNEKRRLSN